jgi:cellulose synthase/poly-beta-1,6-N-acetylglucosamine synthase-like glycosyltransferase
MRSCFFISLGMLVYIYFGYPIVVYLMSRIRSWPVLKKESYQPRVTILIAAYNEEKKIEATIKNKIALLYPKDKIEIIVISDGSTDGTDNIVRSYTAENVKLLRQDKRAGKTAALNLGFSKAGGEIIVFSDANSLYDRSALNNLVRNFADEKVGYVTGKMVYVNDDGSTIGDGCSAYMKYENYLRRRETDIGSIVGVDGGIDAVRKSLYLPMRPDQLPDFILPLYVVEQGYRVVYEPEAILKEPTLISSTNEYSMRVRVTLRALWALHDMRHLLNPMRYGIFAWQLLSHKCLRYFAFIFLICLYISNVGLMHDANVYMAFFLLQNAFCIFPIISRS